MISRRVRIESTLLDGPVMDRGGVTYARLLVKPTKNQPPLRVFELDLTDLSGKPKRERVGVAVFYESSLVVAATFVVRLSIQYQSVEGAHVEVTMDLAARRARVHFSAKSGAIDVVSEVRGPDPGRTSEYDEFLEAPPDEQREIAITKDGVLELPPASEA